MKNVERIERKANKEIEWNEERKNPTEEESRSSLFQHSARVWDDLNYYYSEKCTQKIITHIHMKTHTHKHTMFEFCVGGKAKAMNCATGFCRCFCCWKYTIAFRWISQEKKASFELSLIFLSFFHSFSLNFSACLAAKDRRFEFTIRLVVTKVNNDNFGGSNGSDDEKWNDWMWRLLSSKNNIKKRAREKTQRIGESGTVATTHTQIFTRTNNNIL